MIQNGNICFVVTIPNGESFLVKGMQYQSIVLFHYQTEGTRDYIHDVQHGKEKVQEVSKEKL